MARILPKSEVKLFAIAGPIIQRENNMKMPSAGNYYQRISAVYLLDDAVGRVHVQSKRMSVLVPVLGEKELEEDYLISEAKRLIAADQDVGEEHICVVGIGRL